ncbi:hypothetical protein NXV24_26325 (plasmid) [Bacteroides thetaiotaomicron]|uniref:hypothetical protein n=1 Tax=Bacteroides TaxID=816 RepID=UPI0020A6F1DA|nr:MULTISPECIES: hypothetical protein [Bacteroides]MCS2399809.1 hypothetical protein [Bacteroides thetaiotaomicron]
MAALQAIGMPRLCLTYGSRVHAIPDDGVQQCSRCTPGIRDGVSYGFTMREGNEPGVMAMGEREHRMSCSAA